MFTNRLILTCYSSGSATLVTDLLNELALSVIFMMNKSFIFVFIFFKSILCFYVRTFCRSSNVDNGCLVVVVVA